MKFSIQTFQFETRDVYQAGHACSASEAKALNQARTDRLRETLRRWIVEEQRKAGSSEDELPAETLQALQVRLSEFESSFAFGQHGPRLKSNLTVESEARVLAWERVENWVSSLQTRPPDEELAEQVKILVTDPRILDEARRRVAAKNAVAREALEQIL